jgi:hypothetical protein
VRVRNSDDTIEARGCSALAAILALVACGVDWGEAGATGAPIATPFAIAAPTPTERTPSVKGEVPQEILDPILNEAAALANVAREQLLIVRAESVIWNDGSLGCPEPGMMYTQALVNGYWVVIDAAGQKYDFRVGSRGKFRLCPPGQGHPPSQASAK